MSAYLRIYGDNDDTPCVCSSPFQRFTVSLSEASEPLGGGKGRCNFRALGGGRGSCNSCELYLMIMPSSPFCESRGPRMLMYKFGTLQSLRYDGFPALPFDCASSWESQSCSISDAFTCHAMDPAESVSILNLSQIFPICLKTLAFLHPLCFM